MLSCKASSQWEPHHVLSYVFLGKDSFYLPGSAVANGKQIEDWTMNTPPIYLWSRIDWTAWCIPIAREHGHVSKEQDDYLSGDEYVCDGFPNPLGVPRGWESDRTKKHSGGNLNGMQNEGRSSTGSVLPGENDIAIPFEADDMNIDMDISPINFPNSSADIHSSLESKPPESHGASGIMAGDYGSPDLPSDRVEN
ncbi:hypothetical protein POTOM_048677 [Populus tomentosa]|uniref:DM2 domain-containing protein n=1 Tax=Populus tomentosa TaxID=118781 RepID=A0A8X8CAU7_POPTO|nr:hypothetical protein POTOM_048677 [Populus tomentosa]